MKALVATVLAFSLSALTPASLNAADFSKYMGTYFCTPSAGAGLYFNTTTKAWEGTNFFVNGIGYIVKITDTGKRLERNVLQYVEDDNHQSLLKPVPDRYPAVVVDVKEKGKEKMDWCTDPFKDSEDLKDTLAFEQIMLSSRINCFVGGTRFQFEFNSLRFQADGRGGYMLSKSDKENTDTPFIFIGTCGKID